MADLGEKIKKLAELTGAKNADIARAAGVSRSAVTKWMNGTSEPRAEAIPKIAAYFHYPVEYLMTLEDISQEIFAEYSGKEVAAGQGRINDEYEHTEEYSTVRVVGDSMYPSLHDGDIIRVHHVTDDISPADFAIVKINGDESTVKHVEFVKDGIWLRAENKDAFTDRFYSVQEVMTLPVTIIGKAVSIVERIL
jgi:repressor LexA